MKPAEKLFVISDVREIPKQAGQIRIAVDERRCWTRCATSAEMGQFETGS